MLSCPTITLSQAVDIYCVYKDIDKRKNYKSFLILGQEVWKELFQQTIFSTKNTYVELKKGNPFNYVDIPSDSYRFFSLAVEDKCRNLKPLYYNDKLNVLVKPKSSSNRCNCETCTDCGGMCETIGGLIPITEIVNINGTDYTNVTWIKNCPNGDVFEYRTIWTTQYTFNRGSYDPSYDFSYEIGTSDSEVVQYTLSRKLCKLETLECGCPTQTRSNEDLFAKHCGCYCNPLNPIRQRCIKIWGDCDYYAGSIRLSDCGTKVFVEHVDHLDLNHWLVMSYQTSGIDPDAQTLIPDYAKMALFTGIDYYKNLFNDRISPVIKQTQYYKYYDEQSKLIVYNNKIAIEDLEALPQMANW